MVNTYSERFVSRLKLDSLRLNNNGEFAFIRIEAALRDYLQPLTFLISELEDQMHSKAIYRLNNISEDTIW